MRYLRLSLFLWLWIFGPSVTKVSGAPADHALDFDGKSDCVSLNLKNWPALGNTPHSIEMWVRPDSLPVGRVWLLELSSVSREHHWIYFPNSDLYFGVGGDATGQVKATVPVGKWTHVVTTFGDGILSVFLNGKEVAQTNAKFNFQSNPGVTFSLGRSYKGSPYFNGAIREVSLWDRELNENDIRASMAHPLSGKEPGLLLYWPLDEGKGKVIHDRSGHGNDATVVRDDRWVPAG